LVKRENWNHNRLRSFEQNFSKLNKRMH
jgi:hypothetical protein